MSVWISPPLEPWSWVTVFSHSLLVKVRSRCSFKTWFQPVRNKLFSSSCGSDKRECDCFSRVCSLCMGCHSCCCCCCCHYCCCGFPPPPLVAQTTLQFPGPRETWFLRLFCLCGSLTARTLKTTSTLSRCFFVNILVCTFTWKCFMLTTVLRTLLHRCSTDATQKTQKARTPSAAPSALPPSPCWARGLM